MRTGPPHSHPFGHAHGVVSYAFLPLRPSTPATCSVEALPRPLTSFAGCEDAWRRRRHRPGSCRRFRRQYFRRGRWWTLPATSWRAPVTGGWEQQPGDRRMSLHQQASGQQPCVRHTRQAGAPNANGHRCLCLPDRARLTPLTTRERCPDGYAPTHEWQAVPFASTTFNVMREHALTPPVSCQRQRKVRGSRGWCGPGFLS
jgi:hypothetical protein